MSLKDFTGAAHAFRTFMQRAQEDIDRGGEIRPAVRRFDHSDGRERLTLLDRFRLRRQPLRRRA